MTNIKLRVLLATTLIITFAMASVSEANSRFTVNNESSKKVSLDIYNGGDKLCGFPAKTHGVSAGDERSMGCEGNGNHRCKVLLTMKGENEKWPQICKELHRACQNESKTIILNNKATITITGEDAESASCVITEE